MYGSVFREWKVAALFVGGICMLVGAFFSDGGGSDSLNFRRKDRSDQVAPPAAVPAPTVSATSATNGFASDDELAEQFSDPSEAAPTASASSDVPAASPSPAAVVGPMTAGGGAEPTAAEPPVPSAPADQPR